MDRWMDGWVDGGCLWVNLMGTGCMDEEKKMWRKCEGGFITEIEIRHEEEEEEEEEK